MDKWIKMEFGGYKMELFKKFKTKFMGIMLACAIFLPTVALGMEQEQELKTSDSDGCAFLMEMGSQFLSPYLVSKMGYDKQKSDKAMVGEAFLTPTLSYLAWEGFTWLSNKFAPEKPEHLPQGKQEETKTRKDLRKKIITNGLSNIITAVIIKKLLGLIRENQEIDWKLKAVLRGLEWGTQTISSWILNKTWNWLAVHKETKPSTTKH
jgi:hypothetical protein